MLFLSASQSTTALNRISDVSSRDADGLVQAVIESAPPRSPPPKSIDNPVFKGDRTL
jgi:hypothetical protein